MSAFHEHFMRLALREAAEAAAAGEAPAGCVIALRPRGPPAHPTAARIIGRAHNQTELLKDPTAHAEMIAITQAAAALGDWRLSEAILYATKEPCPMCAGAIVLARIHTVIFGVSDPKRGGESVFHIFNHSGLNHRPEIVAGILEKECREALSAFFQACRKGRRVAKPGQHDGSETDP